MSEPLDSVVQVAGVSLQYGKTRALDELTLSLPARCMVGLIGPDGADSRSIACGRRCLWGLHGWAARKD